MRTVYLDYAAGTPVDPEVLEAMKPFFTEQFYNPSSEHLAARNVRKSLSEARAKVAHILGARPGEIIFTSGATEANNLAVSGVMRRFPEGRLLISAIEHESVLAPALQYEGHLIKVNAHGMLELEDLKKRLTSKTVLVSMILVSNELGTIQPLRKVAELVMQIRKERLRKGNRLPIYLHTDAAQAPSYLDLHVSRLGVDLLTINGGKIYGPKQTGVLYVKAGVTLRPQILGGGQEWGVRSGTENVPGIIGLAKALELTNQNKDKEVRRLLDLRGILEKKIISAYPDAIINAARSSRTPHIISATFPGKDNERLMMELDEAGIQVAVGSACSAGSEEPSHVLKAIGLEDGQIRSTLRFSMSKHTTEKDIERIGEALARLLN